MAKPVLPDAAFGEVWRNISETLRVELASAASAKLSDVQQFQELISLRPRRATGIGTGDRLIYSCRPLGLVKALSTWFWKNPNALLASCKTLAIGSFGTAANRLPQAV